MTRDPRCGNSEHTEPVLPGMMRRFFNTAVLSLLLACASDNTSGPDLASARVRFVHAVADTAALDLRINTQLTTALRAVPYATASAYESVKVGTLSFAAQPSPSESADKPRSIASLSQIRVADGTALTVLGAGQARDTITGRAAALSAYVDDMTPPSAGQARVRVINGSADADGLDIYLSAVGAALPSTPTFVGVDYRSTLTKTVSAGTYAVTVTSLSEPTTVLTTGTVTLPAGGVQTMVVLGYRGALPFGVGTPRRIAVLTMVNRAP
jgi:Domain of unknown function (DUF4397)